ncbi:hypothetical protein [Paractinoplanes durhamensis]|uniref:hypothetical protein n=1 Tax=Paractinoplanes durhamensis TaxID=113563 RepID=UPI003628322E
MVAGGSAWPGTSAVPAADAGKLVATFNSVFKMQDTAGGFALGGRSSRPLADILAIAGGFLLRPVAGALAARVPMSSWFLLTCSSPTGSCSAPVSPGRPWPARPSTWADSGIRPSFMRSP